MKVSVTAYRSLARYHTRYLLAASIWQATSCQRMTSVFFFGDRTGAYPVPEKKRIRAKVHFPKGEKTYPFGILALISTRPNLRLALNFVLSLALITGLMTLPVVLLLTALQALRYDC